MTQQLESIVFDDADLTPHKEKVVMGRDIYWLHEALEEDVVKYNNARAKSARMVDGKVVGVDGAADIEPFLVSLCLYKATTDGSFPYLPNGVDPDPKARVPLTWIRKQVGRVVSRLFNRIKAVSELDDETEEGLIRQLKDLQDRLVALRKNKESVGNVPESSKDTSD